MRTPAQHPVIDWTGCDLVEVDPLRMHGVPVVKGTRMQADSIVVNHESGSPVEEIEENFDIPQDTIRAILSYAELQQRQPRR
jgi:uncharacterized protein (DUF433 family)